jgi:uncharacterized integral membrane protein
MMRIIKLLLLSAILIALVVLAVANRDSVTLNLLPAGMAQLAPGASLSMPLYVVILIAVLTGVLAGYLFEWLREHKHRRAAAEKAREAARLKSEMGRLRKDANRPEDDVLALVSN